MELQEGKRERLGMQAFVPSITGPTIKTFFMYFIFFIWWLPIRATAEFLQFGDLMPKLWCKDKAKCDVNCIKN